MSVVQIASFNVAAQAMSWQRKTWTGRQDDILGSVDHYTPHILCVQENGNAARTRQLTNTLYRAERPLRRAPGGGRWRYVYYDNTTFRLNASGLIKLNKLGTKHAAWAKLTHRDLGVTLFVTSSHLSASFLASDSTRRAEARRLLSETKRLNPNGHREIHAGDFNSRRDVTDAVMKPADYFDSLSVASATQHSGYNTFNDRTTVVPHRSTQEVRGEHLDHIYVDEQVKRDVLYWSQRPDVDPSDHNIITIKVAL